MNNRIDRFLTAPPTIQLEGVPRWCIELLWFGIKELRACLFAGLFFLAMFCVPHAGMFGIARYDILLIIAVAIQFVMVVQPGLKAGTS